MEKRGRRSGAKSAGCASSARSASDECPYRVWSSAGDGSLSSGLGLGSGFGLGVASGVGAAEIDSGVGASRVAAIVESARVDHVGRRERGGVELAGASGVDAAGRAKTARTRAVRRST
jgi:hypothetical protein